VPGVAGVAYSDTLPGLGFTRNIIASRIQIDGRPEDLSRGTQGLVNFRLMSAGFHLFMPSPAGRASPLHPAVTLRRD
jgi:hypothetical protein